ncbi:GrpB family protein [Evansella halocellulosilytica]|uniref:GrpB family protein n=1 Tax=Evansella halocellulosilytica TaxID=2011013 RepID=UPI000BB9170F|nr:GrpB family protein [Evansella halocellulosilytica]
MSDIHDPKNWPKWATETIEIVEPDLNWLNKGEQEKEQLLTLLSSFGVNEIEHYGSTSIPKLPAKPIIDLMAKVDHFQHVEKIASLLASDHWHYVPPSLDNRPWQRFFVKVSNEKRVAHLHLLQKDDERWDMQLQFRDKLRGNPHFVAQYASLKTQLANEFSDDRETYTKEKTAFIHKVLQT